MKIYLVGGAVRDELLGLAVTERDWVVIGETPEHMLALGFRPVGKDFPVFLHPETQEEYALARTERKSGQGHTGFLVNAAQDISLEDDLLRRDLTINAIAQTPEGKLIDPFDGQHDLQQKILRHVSPAFIEDPLRVLRVARFSAKLHSLGFNIAPDTLSLMKAMSKSGELNALVPERIWKEWQRALTEKNPEQFLKTLTACGASHVLFPTIKHPDVCANYLSFAAKKNEDSHIRFAAMLADLSQDDVDALCKHNKIPNTYTELAKLVIRYLPLFQSALAASAEDTFSLFKKTDAMRKPERFEQFLITCSLVSQAQEHLDAPKCQTHLKNVLTKLTQLDLSDLINSDLHGKALGDAIAQKQILAIDLFNAQRYN